METQNPNILDQLKGVLGIASGKESIKVEVGVDAQTGIMLGVVIFAAVLFAVVVGSIVSKKL